MNLFYLHDSNKLVLGTIKQSKTQKYYIVVDTGEIKKSRYSGSDVAGLIDKLRKLFPGCSFTSAI